MGLGEKVKKLFLKLGFRYLPWIAFGTLVAAPYFNPEETDIETTVLHKTAEGGYKAITYKEQRKDTRFPDSDYRGLAATSILGFIGLLGIYGTSRARKRQCVIEPHRGLDKILDYPAALSAGMTATTLACIIACAEALHNFSTPPNLKNNPLFVTTGIGSVGLFVWSAFYGFMNLISKLKSPCMLNLWRIFPITLSNLWNPTEATKRTIESFAVEDDLMLVSRAVLANYENRPLDAIVYQDKYLRLRKRRPALEEAVSMNWAEGCARGIASLICLIENSFQLRKSPEDAALLTERQFIYLRRENERKARQLAQKILSSPKCGDEERILQSFVLDSLGEPEWAERLRQEAFPRLFRENERVKFGKSLLYQKLGLREQLVKESQTLDYLQRFGNRYDFDAARPIGVWDFGRASCLFETFADGESLYDYLEGIPDIGVMRKAAMTQAALHAVLPRDNNYDLEKDVSAFIENLPLHIRRQKLYDALLELLKPVAQYQAADCDGHRENRHFNVSQQITVYDVEARGSSPMPYDYAKLRGQGCSVGTLEQQKDVLVESAGVYNRIVLPERRVPENEFYNNILRASPYKAMRFALFVQKHPERHHNARQFISNAELDLLILDDVLKKESRHVLCDALNAIDDFIA